MFAVLPGAILAAAEVATVASGEAAVTRPAPRRRVELLVDLGASVGGSNWTMDALGYGALTVAVRIYRVIAPYGQVRLGYGRVDQRLLTYLSVGVQGGYPIGDRAYPYLRVGFVHQHEESLAAVAEQPLGALLGIGNGIRHRAGVQVGAGCDFPVFRGRRGEIVVGPEVMLSYLGYSSGPSLYGAVGLQAGGRVFLF